MKIEEVKNKCYLLSGKKAFFHRFCDSGFKTKWTGFWSESRKFFDYFAFRVNESWLSPENCVEVVFDDSSFTHIYSLDGIKVVEKLFVPEERRALVCNLRIESKEIRRLKVFMEVGVNIRDREENWHDRKYVVKREANMLMVNSEKGCLAIGFSKPFEISGKEIYKDHFPGELERCFIPGAISFEIECGDSKEEISIIFSSGKNETEAMVNLVSTKNSLGEVEIEESKPFLALEFKTGIKELDDLFRKSVIGLEKLKVEAEAGFGYIAGYPWFTQFWGRDLGWMIPAIVDYGNFEDAKKALMTLMKFQSREGEIPNFIYLDGKPIYGSIDATPLWIIALNHYIQNSGDLEFLKESKKNIIRAFGWCISKSDDKLMEAEKRATWMDSLDRDGKPIEVQAIWYECLLSLKKLSEILGENLVDFSYVKEVERKIEEDFWNPSSNFYFDRIKWKFKDEKKTINSIFPLLFKISKNPVEILRRIESEEFTSPFGVRSVSKNDPTFNPIGYHTGSVWSWITGLVACVEFGEDRAEKGLEYLKILWKMFDRNCLGSLDEAWNSENGDAVLLKEIGYEPSGFFQGWGFASVVRCLDEFMLGLKVDALNKTIFASPSLIDGMKVLREKRIGNDIVKISMERIGDELKVVLKSGRKKGYRLIKVPKA
ncbi:MAG: amylo-alpha-1,6-glucosidase [Candidatus Aenigmatarchaeota archaeon]